MLITLFWRSCMFSFIFSNSLLQTKSSLISICALALLKWVWSSTTFTSPVVDTVLRTSHSTSCTSACAHQHQHLLLGCSVSSEGAGLLVSTHSSDVPLLFSPAFSQLILVSSYPKIAVQTSHNFSHDLGLSGIWVSVRSMLPIIVCPH